MPGNRDRIRGMRKLLWLLPVLVGCGGGGGGTTTQRFVYDGSWSGTWDCPGISEGGSFSAFIGGEQVGYPQSHSLAGTFEGTVGGNVYGSVSETGQFVLRFYENGFLRWSAYGNFQVNGSEMTEVAGSIVRRNDIDHAVDFQLSR